MHRRNHVLRLTGMSFLIGLLTYALSAQEIQQVQVKQGGDRPDVPAVTMTTGSTQTYRHSSKKNLKRVENPNIKVLNVQRVVGDPTAVLFEAVSPGRTRVTLVDQDDKTDYVDVYVINDRVKELRDLLARAVPTANVTVNSSDTGNNIILTGTVKSVEDSKTVQAIAGQLFGANVVNNIHIGGVQQVQLEVVIAVVNRSRARTMAFSWANNQKKFFIASLFGAPTFTSAIASAATGASSSAAATPANIPFGILSDTGSFQAFLQALNTEGLAKILSEPRLTTLSGRPARIQSGGNVQIVSGGVSSVSLTAEFGTIVTFLPIVLGDGKIHLEVSPELSTPTTAIPIPGAGVAGSGIVTFSTLKRSAQVAVQIEDGQTLAIGGLIQNTVDSSIQRVPFLGDLPFVGMAFTSKTFTEAEEEFIILVTPRLVDPVDCTKIPHFLPGRETRSPDDFELFLEGIMEAPRGQRNVSLLHYKGAHTLSPSAGQYPCNDASGCYRRNGGAGCENGMCGVNTGYPMINGGNVINGTPIPVQPRPATSMPPATNIRMQTPSDLPTVVAPSREPVKATPTSTPPVNFAPMPIAPSREGVVPPPVSLPPLRESGSTPAPVPMPLRETGTPNSAPVAPVKFAPLPTPSGRETAPSFPATTPGTNSETPLPALPSLPTGPVSLGRELENRPVLPPLPPVSFGMANTDLTNPR